jgi:THO complex subunit 2
MQEQERAANEEVEKRLKAALLTKREPGTTASRIASPTIGTPASEILADAKQPPDESSGTDEILMEVDATSPPIVQSTEVSVFQHEVSSAKIRDFQSPWLPELEALFDHIKKIAPGNTYDVIG